MAPFEIGGQPIVLCNIFSRGFWTLYGGSKWEIPGVNYMKDNDKVHKVLSFYSIYAFKIYDLG